MKNIDALQRVGLRQLTQKQYLRKMDKLGEPAMKFMDAIDTGIDPTTMEHVYDLQHENVKISKLVSSISYFDLYLSFLNWITKSLTKPDSFLDLGCGNGLFSLAISQIWEDTVGVGIDKNEPAIRTARELQISIDQVNSIDFLQADFAKSLCDDLKQQIGAPSIVFAAYFFHELMHDEPALMRTLTNLSSILPKSAILISLDRFPETEKQRDKLIRLMRRVGITTKKEELLIVGEERFPLTIFESKAST